MIKLVVFDWNGVILADTQAVLDIDNHILRESGRKPITLAEYRETFTMPVKDFFVALGFPPEEIEREARNVQTLFHQKYEERIKGIRTRSGARELLDFIKERGIEAIVLTNHTTEGLESQLTRLKLKPYFSRVITNDMLDTMATKTKPDKLVKLMQELPYEKHEALIIGDSPEEIEAARKAGIRSVSITGGYYSERRLREAKPDFLIHNLRGMIDIIKRL